MYVLFQRGLLATHMQAPSTGRCMEVTVRLNKGLHVTSVKGSLLRIYVQPPSKFPPNDLHANLLSQNGSTYPLCKPLFREVSKPLQHENTCHPLQVPYQRGLNTTLCKVPSTGIVCNPHARRFPQDLHYNLPAASFHKMA